MKATLLKILLYTGLGLAALLVVVSILPYFFSIKTDFDGNYLPYPESKTFTDDSVKIHYRFFPSDSAKKALIFIHGFSGSTFSWRENIDDFRRAGYDVLAIDLPAFGFSDRSTRLNHSTSQRAKWLWKLCEKLDQDKKWVVVGHSMGASVAAAMCAMKPEKVSHLVMTDGVYASESGAPRSSGGGLTGILLAYPPVRRWAEVIAVNKFFTTEKFIELLSSAYSRTATPEEAEGYRKPFLIPETTSAILSAFKNSREIEKLDYKKISCPKILIWGTDDRWIKIETAENFVKKYPETNFIKIENAGHCPMETHAEIFNEKLLQALKANE